MKIRLDDKHWLNSDQYCYWITVEVTTSGRKGKKSDSHTYERRVSGYTATFSQVVDSFIEKKIKSLESTEIRQLRDEVEKLKNEVMNWKVNLDDKR